MLPEAGIVYSAGAAHHIFPRTSILGIIKAGLGVSNETGKHQQGSSSHC